MASIVSMASIRSMDRMDDMDAMDPMDTSANLLAGQHPKTGQKFGHCAFGP